MAREEAEDSTGAVTPERRKPGRPRVFDGTPVSVRLPSDLHDVLVREALRRDVDLSVVIRERLSRALSYLKTPVVSKSLDNSLGM